MEQMFEDVMEKGEKIIKIYRPNGCKFWSFVWLTYFISVIWLVFIPIGLLFNEDGWVGVGTAFWWGLGATLAAVVISMLITWLCGALWMKNRYCAYTDKRILVRGGIIGIDYKSLEFKSLTATVVKVSLLDKMVRKDTGTIKFGSPASPVLSMWGNHSNQYMFNHIEKPYATLREIKEYINQCPEEKK